MMAVEKRSPPAGDWRASGARAFAGDLKAKATAPRRRLPAFAAAVEQAVREGKRPNVWIFCGPHAWARAAERQHAAGGVFSIAVPDASEIGIYRWPQLESVTLHVGDMPISQALDAARQLLVKGIALVAVVGSRFKRAAILRGGSA
jgi:hypothetical protein